MTFYDISWNAKLELKFNMYTTENMRTIAPNSDDVRQIVENLAKYLRSGSRIHCSWYFRNNPIDWLVGWLADRPTRYLPELTINEKKNEPPSPPTKTMHTKLNYSSQNSSFTENNKAANMNLAALNTNSFENCENFTFRLEFCHGILRLNCISNTFQHL